MIIESWVAAGGVAGLLLGTTDVLTKLATRTGTPALVMAFSSLFGAIPWLVYLFVSWDLPWDQQLLINNMIILPKNAIMIGAWLLTFYGLKHAPLSYASALRSSGPLFTYVLAFLVFGERLDTTQWFGLFLTIVAFLCFSRIGAIERLDAGSLAGLGAILGATILAAATTVYDKTLVQYLSISSLNIQALSAMQRAALGMVCIAIAMRTRPSSELMTFPWITTIALGVIWVGAEYVYFLAYNDPQASATILSVLRRLSLVTTFAAAIVIFREQSIKTKGLALILLAGGTCFIVGAI